MNENEDRDGIESKNNLLNSSLYIAYTDLFDSPDLEEYRVLI